MLHDGRLYIVTSLARNAPIRPNSGDFKVKTFATAELADKWFEANQSYLEWAEFSRTSPVRHRDGSFIRFISKTFKFDEEQGFCVRRS